MVDRGAAVRLAAVWLAAGALRAETGPPVR
jgi:hypothetical protein